MKAAMVGLMLVASSALGQSQRNISDAAIPGYTTGNMLYDERDNRPHFVGYVSGVHDARKVFRSFCTPPRATTVQIADVAEKFLRDNPALRDQQAQILIETAFSQAWPCPK